MGTHRDTGAAITGIEDVRQSVTEILNTPQRTRPLAPTFGLGMRQMIDQPMDARGRARLTTGVMDALKPERRVAVKRVRKEVDIDGQVRAEVEIELAAALGGGETTAPMSPPNATLGAQLRNPQLFYPLGGYDEGTGVWAPSIGTGDMTVEGDTPAVLDGLVLFVAGAQLQTSALGLDTSSTWTVGLLVAVDTPDPAAAVAGLLGDGDTELWVEARGTNNVELVGRGGAEFEPVPLGDITAAPYQVVWLWGWSGQLGGAVGFEGGAHPIPAAADDSRLVIGAATGSASMLVGQVGVWNRVLTRRERLAIAALWTREVEAL